MLPLYMVTGALVLLPRPSHAQGGIAQSFAELSGRVKVGDSVHVTDAQGLRVVGVVSFTSDKSLELRAKDGRRSFRDGDLLKIQKEFRHTRAGVIAGASVGLLGGLLELAYACRDGSDCESHTSQGRAVSGAFVFGGIATLFGGAIGHGFGHLETVYRAPRSGVQSKISLLPVVSPNRQGVVVSIRF